MLKSKVIALALGVFFSLSFVVCVLFGLAMPQNLHMHQFLESVLPGFAWLSVGSFVLGLMESFLWGLYIGLVSTPIYNFFSKRVAI